MLEHLLRVLPPPAAPIETGDADGWKRVEESLGTGLPPDYKAFIAHYGTGAINQFLWVRRGVTIVGACRTYDVGEGRAMQYAGFALP